MTATELLTAFSGVDASEFEAYFRFTPASRIVNAEIHAVGMHAAATRYSGKARKLYEVNNVLRLITADGYEGVSGVDSSTPNTFSDWHLRQLRIATAALPKIESPDPVVVGDALEESLPAICDAVRASIDIALWDLAAKRAGEPLCKMLRANRDKIDVYASLPFFDTIEQYLDAVREYATLGITAFKFHVWGSYDKDLALVDRLRQSFANTEFRFMLDLEEAYDIDDALQLGRKMDRDLFVWIEGPVDDRNLEHYELLRRELEIDVIPGGYSIYSPAHFCAAIDSGAWDAGRFDAAVIGGISKALGLLAIARAAKLPVEIQSWGHTLTQAADLHLMLAANSTRFFEMPMPVAAFSFGMKNGIVVDGGLAAAPTGPGLGVDVDWLSLPEADYYEYTSLAAPV